MLTKTIARQDMNDAAEAFLLAEEAFESATAVLNGNNVALRQVIDAGCSDYVVADIAKQCTAAKKQCEACEERLDGAYDDYHDATDCFKSFL